MCAVSTRVLFLNCIFKDVNWFVCGQFMHSFYIWNNFKSNTDKPYRQTTDSTHTDTSGDPRLSPPWHCAWTARWTGRRAQAVDMASKFFRSQSNQSSMGHARTSPIHRGPAMNRFPGHGPEQVCSGVGSVTSTWMSGLKVSQQNVALFLPSSVWGVSLYGRFFWILCPQQIESRTCFNHNRVICELYIKQNWGPHRNTVIQSGASLHKAVGVRPVMSHVLVTAWKKFRGTNLRLIPLW